MYTQDNDGFFPVAPADGDGDGPNWMEAVHPLVSSHDIFRCTDCPIPDPVGGPDLTDAGYALNYELYDARRSPDAGPGTPASDLMVSFPAATVSLCEVGYRTGPRKDDTSYSTATNAPDTADDLNSGVTTFGPPGALRHNGGSNYGFVDGHVRWYRPDQVAAAKVTMNGVLVGNNGSAPTFAR